MINANELRIGNWIQYRSGDGHIIENTAKSIEHDRIAIGHPSTYKDEEGEEVTGQGFMLLKGVDPVPLTEEWLLKFGLKKGDNKTITSDSFYWIMVGGSHLSINPNNGVVWITKEESVFNNPALIEFVHQLQNLYFALAGTELTIKEPAKQDD